MVSGGTQRQVKQSAPGRSGHAAQVLKVPQRSAAQQEGTTLTPAAGCRRLRLKQVVVLQAGTKAGPQLLARRHEGTQSVPTQPTACGAPASQPGGSRSPLKRALAHACPDPAEGESQRPKPDFQKPISGSHGSKIKANQWKPRVEDQSQSIDAMEATFE